MLPLDSGLARAMYQERLREANQRRLAKIAGTEHFGPIAQLRAALHTLRHTWSQQRHAPTIQLKHVTTDKR
jgi:hypothetical protein